MDSLSLAFEPDCYTLSFKLYANMMKETGDLSATPIEVYQSMINIPNDCWNVILEISDDFEEVL